MLSEKNIRIFGNNHSFERVIPLKALANLKRYETCKLMPYEDSDGLLHQGYGHGPKAGPPEILPGVAWTKEYASQVLMDDVRNFSAIIDKWISVPVTSFMFGALVSLAYNVGPGRLKNESQVLTLINQGRYTKAAVEFLTLNTVQISKEEYYKLVLITPEIVIATLDEEKNDVYRKKLDGLILRRCCEIEVFMTQVWKNENDRVLPHANS